METGEGGTCAWSLGGVDPTTSLALIFDVASKESGAVQPGKRHHLQLITYYQHSSGRVRMRVTTSAGGWWCVSSLAQELFLNASALPLASRAATRLTLRR